MGLGCELNPLVLKAELQCLGLKTGSDINLDRGRKTGAGPAGGRYFILPGDILANVPMHGGFIDSSPFYLHRNDDESLFIQRNQQSFFRVELIPPPRFYEKYTSLGNPMHKVALLHGKDCLATTVNPECVYWRRESQCQFCGIELPLLLKWSMGKKDPQEWHEVVRAAVDERICNHITLTTGDTETSDRGSHQYHPFIAAVKEYNDSIAMPDIPVYVQTSPPLDFKSLDELAGLDVDSIGINLESFDPQVFSTICPGKSKNTSIENYVEAWKYAVKLFGENQVSTFLLLGLGEKLEYIKNGVERMSRIGGIIFPVPFRPIYGSQFQSRPPPSPQYIVKTSRIVADIQRQYGLNPRKCKAGCVRCGACGLSSEALFNDRNITP